MKFSRALRSRAKLPVRGPQPSKGGEAHFAVKRPEKLPENRGGEPLAPGVRVRMEQRFGKDFSRVRVHQGTEAKTLSSVAFAMGDHLYFEPGLYRPDTPSGERLLGHELTHVVQQREMGLSTRMPSRVAVLDDRGLERQADASAGRISRGENPQVGAACSPAVASVPAGAGVAQRVALAQTINNRGRLDAQITDNDALGRATDVNARLIWLANGESLDNYFLGGSAPANAGNPPGWVEYVRGENFPGAPLDEGLPNHRTNWKRLHLLNDNLGGPGDTPFNLTPGRTVTNSAMLNGAERQAKQAVEGGGAIRYRAQVEYNHTGGPMYVLGPPIDLDPAGSYVGQDAFEWFPSRITLTWRKMRQAAGAGSVANPAHGNRPYVDNPAHAEQRWQQQVDPPLNIQDPQRVTLDSGVRIPQAKRDFLQQELGINEQMVTRMSEVMRGGGINNLDDLKAGVTRNIEAGRRFINIV